MISVSTRRCILILLPGFFIFSHLQSLAQSIHSQPNGLYGVIGQPAAVQVEQSYAPQVKYDGIIVDRYRPSSQMISGFKVYGSPYLLSLPVKSNIFSAKGTGYNVFTGYNLYKQDLEIFQGEISLGKLMIKDANEVDSFTLNAVNTADGIKDMSFVNSAFFGSSKKFFVQVIFPGQKFSLLKNYKMVLEDAGNDYGVSGIKNFVLKEEYFYNSNENKALKKLKLTNSSLKKEFPDYKSINKVLSEQPQIDEKLLIKLFASLNE